MCGWWKTPRLQELSIVCLRNLEWESEIIQSILLQETQLSRLSPVDTEILT